MPRPADRKWRVCAAALSALVLVPAQAGEPSPEVKTDLRPLPPVQVTGGSQLSPSQPVETAGQLAPLVPERPLGLEIAPPDERPQAQQLPISIEERAQDKRLHEGLAWDTCGPRLGRGRMPLTQPAAKAQRQPVEITADLVDYDQARDLVQLQGNIEVVQGQARLCAARSIYDRRTASVSASGGVILDYPGLRLISERADYNLESKDGRLEQAGYRLYGQTNLRGAAEAAWLLDDQKSRYRNILYTTCPPGNTAWSLRAQDLMLDQAAGQGVARNAWLSLWDVPVLYTPYLAFPIDGRRRSGFLIPTIGSSEKIGLDLSIPYYWSIAPQMDATLTPRLMSARGLMLGAEWRYLGAWERLEFDGEILPQDAKDPEAGVRGALRFTESGSPAPGWWTAIDYASVSDDRYLTDFGNRLDVTSLRNLSQRAEIQYQGNGWRALGRLQQFQSIDASIAPANRPYGQLPHLELTSVSQPFAAGLEYDLRLYYDYFDHDSAIHGSRLVAAPILSWPLRRSFGYLIPRARLYYTQYDLIDQKAGADSQPSHLIPSFDLDGQLVFEREAGWLGRPALQTLEPRLYYVYTAYADQTDNPRFDTTALDFSFASLFRPNRFTGYDRINDDNRLTLGLTTRTLREDDGDELWRLSLGQIYYFADQRVQLDGPAVLDPNHSALAGEIGLRLHRDWTAQAELQWNPDSREHSWEKQVIQVRYAPAKDRLLSLAYHYNLGTQSSEEYENADLAFQLPLGSRVRMVGRWLYSLLNDETVEAFAGIEFSECCWRMRILGQHLKRDANQPASTSLMLQLELAGLGSVGNAIDKVLQRGIYGYQSD
ncbi:LPS-assembly protein LptD [Caldichromatium japonicum]|uniref:LPS-assembly protein LptD n=2 Tax=Caldichromatium japonicum TaxID=2699430 RepID=A0A6G7VGZ6_9GAMM|nr:LPS-assembly protein LptD [Caldichromatium japonicum]